MRVVLGCLVLALACTKPNPNRCCTDEADCSAKGIPSANTCGEGLLCRGNQCIAQPCTDGSECDPAAPFCVAEACAELCDDDAQCPGYGQLDVPYCVGGTCVHCRDSADCGQDAPVCESGACRICTSHGDCLSDLCDLDTGLCIEESAALYVAVSGSASSMCTLSAPCTLARAAELVDDTKSNIRLFAGEYVDGIEFTRSVTVAMYGGGDASIGSVGGAQYESLRIKLRDLTVGHADCSTADPLKPRSSLDAARVRVGSVQANACDVKLDRVVVTSLEGATINISGTGTSNGGSTLLMTRSEVIGGSSVGISISGSSRVDVSNSVFRGQSFYGLLGYNSYVLSSTFRFNTIYNSPLYCQDGAPVFDFSNNLFFNESGGAPANTVTGTQCRHNYDMIKPQGTAPAGANNVLGANPTFVNAGAGDFHLKAGSPAIDQADPLATEAMDFDGTPRPQGAKRDVGAFEYKP